MHIIVNEKQVEYRVEQRTCLRWFATTPFRTLLIFLLSILCLKEYMCVNDTFEVNLHTVSGNQSTFYSICCFAFATIWKPLAHRRRERRLTLLFKIINGLVAIPATDHIVFNTRPSRSGHNKQIKVITTNTDIYKNSFFPLKIGIHYQKVQ